MNEQKIIADSGYNEYGSGRTTLIMVHGNSMDKESFKLQADSDLKQRFKIISVDFPGHGDTRTNGSKQELYSIPGFTEFLVRFTEQLDTENCVIVGHSLGGHIAVEAAAKIPNLKGLFIFGTPPLTFRSAEHPPFNPVETAGLLFQETLTEDEAEQLAATLWHPDSSPPEDFKKSISATDPLFRSAMGRSVTDGEFQDEIEQIEQLPFPTAIVLGSEDTIINSQYIRKMVSENIWRGEVQIISGAGHSPQLEKPEKFNGLLHDYLNDLGL